MSYGHNRIALTLRFVREDQREFAIAGNQSDSIRHSGSTSSAAEAVERNIQV
jgi:hypothetical protein